jgi:hypothetical protein
MNANVLSFKTRFLIVVLTILALVGVDAFIRKVRLPANEASAIMAQVNANTEVFPIVVDGKKIGEMIDRDFGWRPTVTKDVIQVGHTTGLRGYVFSVNGDNPANDVGSWRLAVTQDVAGKVGIGLYPQVAFVEEGGQMVHVFERRIILDRAMEQKIYYVATGPVGGSDAYKIYKRQQEDAAKK